MKRCSRCEEDRELSEFRRDATKKDGHHSVCKDCRRETDAEQKLQRRYGIGRDEWIVMHHAQKGRCAICCNVPRYTLQVDHCHATGKIRGLLCGACNKAIGLLRDEPLTISRAALYVARHQGA